MIGVSTWLHMLPSISFPARNYLLVICLYISVKLLKYSFQVYLVKKHVEEIQSVLTSDVAHSVFLNVSNEYVGSIIFNLDFKNEQRR